MSDTTTLDMLTQHLKKHGAFQKTTHYLVEKAYNVISGEVPHSLKMSIALSELVTLTSHLRKNIRLYDGTIVPCNMINFSLAGSGVSKDSSMNMVRKALATGYDQLDKKRKDIAKKKAEKLSIIETGDPGAWLTFYEEPKPLQAGLGTVEGLVKHFSGLEGDKIGAGFVSSSEIGTELLTNGSITDIIKTISIGYDLGKIPAKIVKSAEGQTHPIESLPINALFFGSEDAILYDNKVKNLFKMMFGVQLARRSIFSFSSGVVSPPEFTTVEELSNYRNNERQQTFSAQQELLTIIDNIVEETTQEPLKLTEEAQSLFDVYKEYNLLVANDMKAQYPISKLSRRHKQWLALKLSGNFAILDGNDYITTENYITAINTVETFADDLTRFETELVKEPYEIFVEFCKHNAVDGKYTISVHTLRKLGYIPTTGTTGPKIEELVKLAASYDTHGIYTACDDGICYEEQVNTEIVGVSYLYADGTKEERQEKCSQNFEFYETEFHELAAMLSEDLVYSPFQFKHGKRSKENVVGGCSWVALDIDDSTITDEECHLMLEGINHHIARTSDASNQFKFRVLVELDAIVDISDLQWRHFISHLADDLGLKVDLLPKSQIYFAYEGRDVLSTLDGEPVKTKEFIMKSANDVAAKPSTKKLSSKAQQDLLDNKFDTFGFAFDAEKGTGSRSLIRAAYYAKDLGANHKFIVELIKEINDYWVTPMDEQRLENTILSQIHRWF